MQFFLALYLAIRRTAATSSRCWGSRYSKAELQTAAGRAEGAARRWREQEIVLHLQRARKALGEAATGHSSADRRVEED